MVVLGGVMVTNPLSAVCTVIGMQCKVFHQESTARASMADFFCTVLSCNIRDLLWFKTQ